MATERAKNIAEQINEQITLYPEGYTLNTNQISEQQKQFREQKDVWARFLRFLRKCLTFFYFI